MSGGEIAVLSGLRLAVEVGGAQVQGRSARALREVVASAAPS